MKIYVGNLSLLVTDADLDLIFKPFGEVGEIKVFNDKLSNLRVALVEMKNESDAMMAVKVLDGIELFGHTIDLRVREENADRRIELERRVLVLRRTSSDRRLTVESVDSENRQVESKRCFYVKRRQLEIRRAVKTRRASPDRRAIA